MLYLSASWRHCRGRISVQIKANRLEGYQLLHDGCVALAQVEANGIRIDTAKLAQTDIDLSNKIRDLRKSIEGSAIWKVWRRRFGEKSNVTSRDQLAIILHQDLGFQIEDTTETGRPATDEDALGKIDHPDLPTLLRLSKYEKARGTYLKGIEKEVVGDRIHPVFNLHTARSYRSSSDSPNFQNFPVRDKEIAKIIRTHFIPSEGSVLVENDFKGIEVMVSSCYHHDENFISYITTPGKDMHRDMAAQIYKLKPEDVSKDARYGAKNKFVFPQFYGDYYVACARNCWEWIEKGKLTGPNGIPLKEHLEKKGITKLGKCDPERDTVKGTFEHHMKEVEDDFWNARFKGYGKWRRDWYRAYLDKGYFDLLSGFRVYGSFPRNSVTNYPIQGSAFHCLLWSLIQVNKALRRHKMKSMIVGQIHDSLISDVRVDELKSFLAIVDEVITVKLREHFKWLIIPLEIEYEITPSIGSWYDKVPVEIKKGRFHHPDDPTKFTTDPFKFIKTIDKRYARTKDGNL